MSAPPDCNVVDAGEFVSKHIDWVKQHLDDLPPTVTFSDGAVVPVRGEDYCVQFVGRTRRGKVVWIEPRQEELFSYFDESDDAVPAQNHLCVSGMVEHAPRRLRDWLIGQAKSDLSARVGWHARNLGLTPKRITVRDQTTRWGSCSSTGALSFSWRLVLAPPAVLDYVAAHEVAHLQEMNHGPRFWKLVRKTMPDMETPKRWLHDNGALLHSYGG